MPQPKHAELDEQHCIVSVGVSNSQQSAVMHSNDMNFNIAAGFSNFVSNVGK